LHRNDQSWLQDRCAGDLHRDKIAKVADFVSQVQDRCAVTCVATRKAADQAVRANQVSRPLRGDLRRDFQGNGRRPYILAFQDRCAVDLRRRRGAGGERL
jgi:hypothetical protein